ncbi:hypothetical protein [Glutamicibacter sp.]|uniref:hypothetical protein n=1 Tax=Glutamicibacter sp. TaxID=1931995 RepID=UPI002B467CF3|nr:hypothetical protein [Glutamicibacter sp.]HJX79993.1 hypothetical protein [Glutamicibacter sp.]
MANPLTCWRLTTADNERPKLQRDPTEREAFKSQKEAAQHPILERQAQDAARMSHGDSPF